MWLPETEADLETAARAGTLDENTTRLEFKQQIDSTEAGRRRIAEELASLAVDGGVLIVGVVDTKHRATPTNPTDALHPVPLAGEPERIEQIAATRPDPPLFVRTRPVPSSADPSKGYLVVEVPLSPVGPHQVDGRYWGRGDTAKRVLTDAEVIRLHERRRRLDEDASRPLAHYMDRDPVPSHHIQHAHLFIVAEPRAGRPDMLLDVADDRAWQQWVLNLTHARQNNEPRFGAMFAPDFDYATNVERRPDGWAATSYGLSGRQVGEVVDEAALLEVEVTTHGGVRVYCGRASDSNKEGAQDVIFEQLIAGLAYRAICLAADIATRTSYYGEWALGFGANRLLGAKSWLLTEDFRSSGIPYPEQEHRRLVRASSAELQERPKAVVERLVGRLVRMLGTERHPRVATFLDVERA
jgi:hypothetical protein